MNENINKLGTKRPFYMPLPMLKPQIMASSLAYQALPVTTKIPCSKRTLLPILMTLQPSLCQPPPHE